MAFEYRPRDRFASPIDVNRCKASVSEPGRLIFIHQCQRRPWKDGWCKQHHPETEAKRREASRERYEREERARIAASPWTKLDQAHAEIVRLKARIAELEGDAD